MAVTPCASTGPSTTRSTGAGWERCAARVTAFIAALMVLSSAGGSPRAWAQDAEPTELASPETQPEARASSAEDSPNDAADESEHAEPVDDLGAAPSVAPPVDAGPEDVEVATPPDAGAASPTEEPDVYGGDDWSGAAQAPASPGRFFLEDIAIEGNRRTRSRVIRAYVPLTRGDLIDPEDEDIEGIRWRLLATGWFRSVHLRLRRGSERGWVVLVVSVEERNTIIVEQLAFGASEGITRSSDTSVEVMPYAGVQLAETNLLGLGSTLRLSLLGAQRQQAARVSFVVPHLRRRPAGFAVSAFFHNGREFFGNDPLVSIGCPPLPEECDPAVEARNAVVIYRRGGFELGTGRDVGASTRYRFAWRGEAVGVLAMPDAASETYGSEVRPIDFAIKRGRSYVSSVRVGLVYDRRDDPALPTRGLLVDIRATVGAHFLGSDYDFLKATGRVSGWLPVPWARGHSLRLGAFLGAIYGNAPFFYLFHGSDLSDLVPSRVLEMQLDHRAPPNLLGTSVGEMQAEEVAARLDVEYGMPLYRGHGGVRALNAYFLVGFYGLSDLESLNRPVPGYRGASRLPVDLTFDVGLRMDTDIGVFQLGFSNILGFIQL